MEYRGANGRIENNLRHHNDFMCVGNGYLFESRYNQVCICSVFLFFFNLPTLNTAAVDVDYESPIFC